jgi:hypothetical protein
MAAAANFAFTNRQLITYWVRRVNPSSFQEIWGATVLFLQAVPNPFLIALGAPATEPEEKFQGIKQNSLRKEDPSSGN